MVFSVFSTDLITLKLLNNAYILSCTVYTALTKHTLRCTWWSVKVWMSQDKCRAMRRVTLFSLMISVFECTFPLRIVNPTPSYQYRATSDAILSK